MIRKISIQNFRGFENVICDNLAPITLVGGRNNCGKSTFLEAIAINSNLACFDLSVTLNEMRGIKLEQFKDIESLFHGGDTAKSFVVSTELADGRSRFVEATCKQPEVVVYEPPKSTIPSQEFVRRLENLFHIDLHVRVEHLQKRVVELDDHLYFSQDGEHHFAFTRLQRPDIKDLGCYVSPRSMAQLSTLLEPLFKEKRMSLIGDALREVDGRINGIDLFDGKVWANVADSPNMLPIQSLGDGMLKIVTYLALVLTASAGSTVCLDEIENGLHYSAMLPLWRALMKVAFERNVQLVVTSHNIEMMRQVSRDEIVGSYLGRPDAFAYLNLAHYEDQPISVKHYDFKRFAYAVQNSLEVR